MQRNKNRRKEIRISELELKALSLMSNQEGRNQSAMLRELIREGAKRRGLDPLIFTSDIEQIIDSGKSEGNHGRN